MNETTTQQNNETTQNNTVNEFLKTWNPTRQDTPDPRNEYIAQNIFGMVACEGWNYINFGSAGVPL